MGLSHYWFCDKCNVIGPLAAKNLFLLDPAGIKGEKEGSTLHDEWDSFLMEHIGHKIRLIDDNEADGVELEE